MKVAIASTENTLNSTVDLRFGRCAWFLIYDTENQEYNFINNTAKDAQEGAGPAVVKLIASQGVKKVVSGEFGVKVRPLLNELAIEMITIKDTDKALSEVVKMFNN